MTIKYGVYLLSINAKDKGANTFRKLIEIFDTEQEAITFLSDDLKPNVNPRGVWDLLMESVSDKTGTCESYTQPHGNTASMVAQPIPFNEQNFVPNTGSGLYRTATAKGMLFEIEKVYEI